MKTVLVTGAAAGIGAGIAERFSEAGYAVAAFDNRRARRNPDGGAPARACAGDRDPG